MTLTQTADEQTKIGGWLILVGIGLLIAPLRMLMIIVPTYQEVLQPDVWAMLAVPGGLLYHPLWAPILIGEIATNTLLFIVSLILIVMFFRKSQLFPKAYIIVAIFTLTFILVDAAAVKVVLPDEPMLDPDTMKEVTRSLVSVLIWCPYMLVSKRVKATFTN